ncbi:hypothetical protein KJ695_00145 [Patescibacteria group bacterium]|nr:hypothetical protein [Patescibacteria group bacterium]MBU4056309.1 hypothetical protein [Patescibacteria group bacterium]MBU4368288.1 hypothetical protein [Patescibacteria group bacterium]
MAEENKEEELEKTVEQKEAPVSLEGEPEKIETLDEALEKGERGKEGIINKAVKEIGDEKKTLETHGADSAQIGEFNKGRKEVEEGVAGAEKVYTKATEDLGDNKTKTRDKILQELEKINNEMDKGYRNGLGLPETDKLKKQRGKLLDLLGDKDENIGRETGYIGKGLGQKAESTEAGHIKEIAEERPNSAVKEEVLVKTEDKAVEARTISEKANKEIKKLLKDPASELSVLMKAANFREDYIQKLKDDLEKAKVNKVDREVRVKFYEKSIAEHEATLEKHKKRIKEIISKIEEK